MTEHQQAMQELAFKLMDVHHRIVALTIAHERMTHGTLHKELINELLDEQYGLLTKAIDEMAAHA